MEYSKIVKLEDSTWLILLLFAFYFLQNCYKAKDKKAILISTKLQFTNKLICNNNTIYWSSSAKQYINALKPSWYTRTHMTIKQEHKNIRKLDKLAT